MKINVILSYTFLKKKISILWTIIIFTLFDIYDRIWIYNISMMIVPYHYTKTPIVFFFM